MEYLPIEIKNDDFVLKIEKEIIESINDSVKKQILEYSLSSDEYLRYSVNTNIIIPENTEKLYKISLYTDLRKNNQSNGMEGRISDYSENKNDFTDVEGSIHIIGTNVTGQISMKYSGRCYSGDIKGESVCEGFTPIFTCVSDLHSDSENSSIHLKCVFASTITRLCSDHNFYDELSDKYGLGVIPYSKYISGWKKVGHSYRYISPETQTSVKTPKYPVLSSENVVEALQYINNDMGMLIFFHSLRSLIFRFFKPVHHAALNINCDMMIKDEAIEYISSIVDFFGSPNITRGINAENFALNHKFKITDYMRNIDEMKKDTRLFKDFPVLNYKLCKRIFQVKKVNTKKAVKMRQR